MKSEPVDFPGPGGSATICALDPAVPAASSRGPREFFGSGSADATPEMHELA